eukprot:c9446_g1_i1 orf=85-366(+)
MSKDNIDNAITILLITNPPHVSSQKVIRATQARHSLFPLCNTFQRALFIISSSIICTQSCAIIVFTTRRLLHEASMWTISKPRVSKANITLLN